MSKADVRRNPGHPSYYRMRWKNLIGLILAACNFALGMEYIPAHPLAAALMLVLCGVLLAMFFMLPMVEAAVYQMRISRQVMNEMAVSIEMMKRHGKTNH